MDSWLTDQVKEILIQPCLRVAGHIGRRLNDRLAHGQDIDERALTEDLVDRLDSSMLGNVWGTAPDELRDRKIYFSASVRKSSREHRTGADLGLIIRRSTSQPVRTDIEYACLIQCKRIDRNGGIRDFFHEVRSSKRRQSDLMLEITPSSFYFLYVPPAFISYYCSMEPLAFIQAAPGCSIPAWNLGLLEHEGAPVSFLSATSKTEIAGILVVPALAVEAHKQSGTAVHLQAVLPNCVPFWYWFGRLFLPAFVGDRSPETLAVARNTRPSDTHETQVGVQFSVEVSLSNG